MCAHNLNFELTDTERNRNTAYRDACRAQKAARERCAALNHQYWFGRGDIHTKKKMRTK